MRRRNGKHRCRRPGESPPAGGGEEIMRFLLTIVYAWKFVTQGGYRANQWRRWVESELVKTSPDEPEQTDA